MRLVVKVATARRTGRALARNAQSKAIPRGLLANNQAFVVKEVFMSMRIRRKSSRNDPIKVFVPMGERVTESEETREPPQRSKKFIHLWT